MHQGQGFRTCGPDRCYQIRRLYSTLCVVPRVGPCDRGGQGGASANPSDRCGLLWRPTALLGVPKICPLGMICYRQITSIRISVN